MNNAHWEKKNGIEPLRYMFAFAGIWSWNEYSLKGGIWFGDHDETIYVGGFMRRETVGNRTL